VRTVDLLVYGRKPVRSNEYTPLGVTTRFTRAVLANRLPCCSQLPVTRSSREVGAPLLAVNSTGLFGCLGVTGALGCQEVPVAYRMTKGTAAAQCVSTGCNTKDHKLAKHVPCRCLG
jgi:hypothetical protein